MRLPVSLTADEQSSAVSGEVSTQAGTLWIADNGNAGYWRGGLSLNAEDHFFLAIDTGQAFSNLPAINGSLLTVNARTGFDTGRWGFTAAFGIFQHPSVQAVINTAPLSNGGGDGFWYTLETPVRFGFLSVTPRFMYGEGTWQDGELYWFFGKPRLPALWSLGLDLCFDRRGLFSHNLGFRQTGADPVIVSNENEPLFDAHIDSSVVWYQLALQNAAMAFSGTLGWLYVKAAADGELNMSNQPYFLFPYRFWNVTAEIAAHAGFAALSFRHNVGIFRYQFDLGAVHVLSDRGSAAVQYQRKNLFGGEEFAADINPHLSGIGAAFLLAEVSLPALRVGTNRGQRLFLGLHKAFAVPWGYEQLLSRDSGGKARQPSQEEILALLKTALLSGLSIRGSLSW